MEEKEFLQIAAEEWERMPERFKARVQNVALLVEDEPDADTRIREGLTEGHTLLGIYRGIPNTERGEGYGVGGTIPDTITLYRLPLLEQARELAGNDDAATVRTMIRETIWHEVGHYFGYDEASIHEREQEGSNHFQA